jgi:hypothetical protein
MKTKNQLQEEIKQLEKQRKIELENSSSKSFKFARNKALVNYNELGITLTLKRKAFKSLF